MIGSNENHTELVSCACFLVSAIYFVSVNKDIQYSALLNLIEKIKRECFLKKTSYANV